MAIGRFLAGTTLAIGVGLAAYLTLTKQSPKTWGNQIKEQVKHTAKQIDDVQRAKGKVSHNVSQLQAALATAQPTLTDIQTNMNKFEFKTAAHLSVIQEVLDRQND